MCPAMICTSSMKMRGQWLKCILRIQAIYTANPGFTVSVRPVLKMCGRNLVVNMKVLFYFKIEGAPIRMRGMYNADL